MTREEFKVIAQQAIEQVTVLAEAKLSRPLPRRFCFSWIAHKEIVADGDIAEFLTSQSFIDETHIAPCWDLFLEELLLDGRLRLIGYRAGYPPCPFGQHVEYGTAGHGAGHVGPFKLGYDHLVDQLMDA